MEQGGHIVNGGNVQLRGTHGTADGPAGLFESIHGTTGLTVDATTGKTSVIHQEACPAGATACKNGSITLAGQLTVTAIGTPSGSYVPIYSDLSQVGGAFSAIPAGYGADYNEGPTTALPDLVGDMVLNS